MNSKRKNRRYYFRSLFKSLFYISPLMFFSILVIFIASISFLIFFYYQFYKILFTLFPLNPQISKLIIISANSTFILIFLLFISTFLLIGHIAQRFVGPIIRLKREISQISSLSELEKIEEVRFRKGDFVIFHKIAKDFNLITKKMKELKEKVKKSLDFIKEGDIKKAEKTLKEILSELENR
uniref:Uncharacterized protein n=1 Tax=candidate division WOR-3 bacterium TaxID=2052148 RepID=A0A7C4U708_UNCW3